MIFLNQYAKNVFYIYRAKKRDFFNMFITFHGGWLLNKVKRLNIIVLKVIKHI